ncbi:O-antigen ligase family protein [Gammaproteobacteria bacterium]|nr:O-antigen ligase family protein [Gammaproteobacteria bacterium]
MNLFFTGVFNPDLEFFNRNELASYLMALFYLISVRLIITNRIARSSLPIVFFLAMMFVFFVTFSRQAIISSTLTLFIFTVFIGSTKSKFLIVSACIAILSLTVNLISTSERDNQRIDTIVNLEPATRADKQRLENIIFGLSESVDKPFFGHGPQSFIRNSPHNKVAHNTYITTIYEYGLFGIFFLFYILYKLIRPLRSSLKSSSNYIKFIAIFPSSYVFQLFFIESFAKIPIYIFLGSSIALYSFLTGAHEK